MWPVGLLIARQTGFPERDFGLIMIPPLSFGRYLVRVSRGSRSLRVARDTPRTVDGAWESSVNPWRLLARNRSLALGAGFLPVGKRSRRNLVCLLPMRELDLTETGRSADIRKNKE